MATVDAIELETKVKDLYRHVAEQPQGSYHFEMGRALAERLGYPADLLDRIPARRSSPSRGRLLRRPGRSPPGRAGDGSGQQHGDVARQNPEVPVAKPRSPTSASTPGGGAARAMQAID